MSRMDLMVNGFGHPKKGSLGQESETYKRRQLESGKGIKSLSRTMYFSSKSYSECS